MVYVISLEKLTDLRLNLWSHDILGVVSSDELVPKVLFDLTLEQFPQVVELCDLDKLFSRLTYAFLHREDNNYFKYTVEVGEKFEGNFYVELVPTLE
jgi:hypothetical protein